MWFLKQTQQKQDFQKVNQNAKTWSRVQVIDLNGKMSRRSS